VNFIRRYSLRKRPVRLAAQAEVVDVRCRGARDMGDPYQGLMKALVD
jgi:hypothetical protein